MATIVRFTRAGVLDTMQKDFVLYERAVGYPRRRLIWIYVLRNSVTATVTQIGLLFGALIAGGVVVEGDLRLAGHRQTTRAGDTDRRLPGDAGGDPADRRDLRRRSTS